MSRDTRNIPALPYIRELFAQESAALQAIDTAIKAEDQPIHISAEEGKLLHLLARMIGAKSIVEVGTLAGYSALWMAEALPEDGKLYTIDKDATRLERTRKLLSTSPHHSKITLLHGDGATMLESLTPLAPFDMIFIDADKIRYPVYLDWAEQNIRSGGLIIGDNTLLSGAVYGQPDGTYRIGEGSTRAMQEFNLRLANRDKYCSILLPSQDGMTIAMKL